MQPLDDACPLFFAWIADALHVVSQLFLVDARKAAVKKYYLGGRLKCFPAEYFFPKRIGSGKEKCQIFGQ